MRHYLLFISLCSFFTSELFGHLKILGVEAQLPEQSKVIPVCKIKSEGSYIAAVNGIYCDPYSPDRGWHDTYYFAFTEPDDLAALEEEIKQFETATTTYFQINDDKN